MIDLAKAYPAIPENLTDQVLAALDLKKEVDAFFKLFESVTLFLRAARHASAAEELQALDDLRKKLWYSGTESNRTLMDAMRLNLGKPDTKWKPPATEAA